MRLDRGFLEDFVSSLQPLFLVFFALRQEPGVYPGPLKEIEFWTERAANLDSLHEQLTSERISKVIVNPSSCVVLSIC